MAQKTQLMQRMQSSLQGLLLVGCVPNMLNTLNLQNRVISTRSSLGRAGWLSLHLHAALTDLSEHKPVSQLQPALVQAVRIA